MTVIVLLSGCVSVLVIAMMRECHNKRKATATSATENHSGAEVSNEEVKNHASSQIQTTLNTCYAHGQSEADKGKATYKYERVCIGESS